MFLRTITPILTIKGIIFLFCRMRHFPVVSASRAITKKLTLQEQKQGGTFPMEEAGTFPSRSVKQDSNSIAQTFLPVWVGSGGRVPLPPPTRWNTCPVVQTLWLGVDSANRPSTVCLSIDPHWGPFNSIVCVLWGSTQIPGHERDKRVRGIDATQSTPRPSSAQCPGSGTGLTTPAAVRILDLCSDLVHTGGISYTSMSWWPNPQAPCF